MSTSPTLLYARSLSPDLSLPMNHSQLMDTYRTWSTFSPRVHKKSYKKDAASLVVSWIKRILRKKLSVWRLNCSSTRKQRIDLSIKIKQPSVFTNRRVFLQVEREGKFSSIPSKVSESSYRSIINDVSSVRPDKYKDKAKTKTCRLLFVNKKKLEDCYKKKQLSARKVLHVIDSNVRFKYMDFFFMVLFLTKRYWIGRKFTKIFRGIVRSRFSFLHKQLTTEAIVNSISTFKVFVTQTVRSVTYEASINYSPRDRLEETATRDTIISKTNPFQCTPVKVGKWAGNSPSTLDNEENYKDIQALSRLSVSPDLSKKKIEFMLEQSFENIRDIMRFGGSSGFNTARVTENRKPQLNMRLRINKMIRLIVKNHKLNLVQRIKIWKEEICACKRLDKLKIGIGRLEKSYHAWINSRKSLVIKHINFHFRLLQGQRGFLLKLKGILKIQLKSYVQKLVNADSRTSQIQRANEKYILSGLFYIIRLHVSVSSILAWKSIQSYSEAVRLDRSQKTKEKLDSVFGILSYQIMCKYYIILNKFKKYQSEALFFGKHMESAKNHRAGYLRTTAFKLWKRRKDNNKKLCRAFEMLGRFFNIKKAELFENIRIPHPLSYYTGKTYQILSKLAFILKKKKENEYFSMFSKWKINRIASVRLLRVVSILNKHVSLNLLTSWQLILETIN